MKIDYDNPLGLNAPFGARCFLTTIEINIKSAEVGLNAPFGARCFLTRDQAERLEFRRNLRLNAPFGARCFLTSTQISRRIRMVVLS